MTQEEIQAIRARAEAATPGPWAHTVFDVYIAATDDGLGNAVNLFEAYTEDHEENVIFIAHARTDIPALLDHIAALEAENARLQGYERLMMLGNPQGRMAELEAENARMRAVVAAVAERKARYGNGACDYCGRSRTSSHHHYTGSLIIGTDYDHTADCPVTAARAILASASDGGNTNEPPA